MVMKAGSFGSQPDRWYSGRMAREAPWLAAERRYSVATEKLCSGSRGYINGRSCQKYDCWNKLDWLLVRNSILCWKFVLPLVSSV